MLIRSILRVMTKEKSQLNVQIDPQLLIALKFEAVNSGMTLSAFVTERLTKSNHDVKEWILEERLQRIEKELDLLKKFKLDVENKFNLDGENKINHDQSIFTDSGAKKYGEIAREIFVLAQKKRKISFDEAFKEFSKFLANYNSHTELVFKIFSGKHNLNGLEMTNAYRNGSCGMRNALHDWTNSSLDQLNEAFLNAVMVDNLV